MFRNDFNKAVEGFMGIPYAHPPLGGLRFARPRPVFKSNETFKASKYGPSCPGKSLTNSSGSDSSSEDCLTVNVFRPALEINEPLPVGVYFHGGGFSRGAARNHDTASMVSWAEPFIGVSFNYRLGALGFLNSEMMHEQKVLNLGLHDQVMLLDWVQQNIAAFGGDPEQVTVFGNSAGAHSIGHHLYNNKTVFHRAIMESGGPFSRALHPYNSTLNEEQFQTFMSEVNCTDIKCLRKANITNILNASDTVFSRWSPSLRWAWQPVIDGELVPGRPLENTPRNVTILTGFNTNEGSLFVPQNLSTSTEFDTFFNILLPQLNRTTVNTTGATTPIVNETVAEIYPEKEYVEWRKVGKQFRRLEAAYGQYAYSCAVRQNAAVFENVYLYHWAVNRTVLGGASHGDQVSYETMSNDVRRISSTQRQLARLFHGYITSFIVHGDPNGGYGDVDRPNWNQVSDQNKTMIIGAGNNERAGGPSKGVVAQLVHDTWAIDECKYWSVQSRHYED
ncbi:hypothetical protein B0A52_04943 [Exophiala mesophila]|uniref:Carboxylic ester hydrolase n=1 Tax=Exophiala mesophila TaxID=212818 RepID=A0A438N6H2_EXOME|nr:hypothetical protein B0A52_04943 [Exophiala mesophila]